ncbi:MAG: energy transducer TonB [Bacteroidetes bacterium]|nr:MAG: energy transducer TonB [Bacteroidota bacterium]
MEIKKNPKVDIRKNSGLYFAIGLNIMLLITYTMLEYKTYDKQDTILDVLVMNQELENETPLLKIETPPPPPPPKAAPEVITIVEDIIEIEETIIESTETTLEEKIEDVVKVEDVNVDEVEEVIKVPFSVVENPPIYPGCEGLSKSESKKCFQTRIQAHIKKNFIYPETALNLGINGKVFVLFVIDSKGYVSNIRLRGPDKILEKEALRIINLLPKMTPGKQRGRAVKVPYSIPIHFKLASY